MSTGLGCSSERCFVCGGDHSSGGWLPCAQKVRLSTAGFEVHGRRACDLEIAERFSVWERFPPLFEVGRKKALKDLVRRMSCPSRLVGTFPALLYRTREEFDAAVREARRRWWREALSRLRLAARTLKALFPDYPRPALPLPALVFRKGSRRSWYLLLDSCVLHLTGGFWVLFYPGLLVDFWVPGDLCEALNAVLREFGAAGVSVSGTLPLPSGSGIRAVLEDQENVLAGGGY